MHEQPKRDLSRFAKVEGFVRPHLRTWVLLSLLLFAATSLKGQPPSWWQHLHGYDGVSEWSDYMTYTSANFGPNALPVPELPDGRVDMSHLAELSTDVFWGFGDQTQSLSARLTYVFIPGRLAITGSGVILEHYKTTMAVRDARASLVESAQETLLIGDFYLSTQMALLRQSAWLPDVSFDIMLKTASSSSPVGARYFDTPGYVFRLAAGKSWVTNGGLVDSMRFAANIGFLCYQLNNRYQNDAPLYGALLRMHHANVAWEGGVGGYNGWIGGDKPLVFRTRLSWKTGALNYFVGYQHAFRDYPFRRFQTGVSVSF